jgi:hypothetical protein
VEGVEYLDKVICIDQSPIGRTPRSNPATYTGAFTPIRDLVAWCRLRPARRVSGPDRIRHAALTTQRGVPQALDRLWPAVPFELAAPDLG